MSLIRSVRIVTVDIALLDTDTQEHMITMGAFSKINSLTPSLQQTSTVLTNLGIMAFLVGDKQILNAAMNFDIIGVFELLLAKGQDFLNGQTYDEFIDLVKKVGIVQISMAVIFALKSELVGMVRGSMD